MAATPLFLPVSRKGKNANESPAGHKPQSGFKPTATASQPDAAGDISQHGPIAFPKALLYNSFKRTNKEGENMAVNLDVLLERGQMALEDGDFSAAEQFFEAALNQDPHLGKAWWGKFLAKNQCASAIGWFPFGWKRPNTAKP